MTPVTILIKRDSIENLKQYNPILKEFELVVAYKKDKIKGYKIGDGKTPWNKLRYIKKITDLGVFCLYTPRGLSAKVFLDPRRFKAKGEIE